MIYLTRQWAEQTMFAPRMTFRRLETREPTYQAINPDPTSLGISRTRCTCLVRYSLHSL